jgi:hypothetical protein
MAVCWVVAKTGSARPMPKPEVHVQCQKPEAYVQWYKHDS